MEVFGYTKEKDFAKFLQLKQQNFSNRKKRGTLLPDIVQKCIELHPEVNLHWLITGSGSKYAADELNTPPMAVDKDLLAGVLKGVEDYLKKGALMLDPEPKARLVAILYDRFDSAGQDVNPRIVSDYLKLVA